MSSWFNLLNFVGLDACFIKLCTGAQILAAAGRDGNNNMYPLAFAVVGKEDTANWCWFLTQLKYALGGEEGKFGTYTIMVMECADDAVTSATGGR